MHWLVREWVAAAAFGALVLASSWQCMTCTPHAAVTCADVSRTCEVDSREPVDAYLIPLFCAPWLTFTAVADTLCILNMVCAAAIAVVHITAQTRVLVPRLVRRISTGLGGLEAARTCSATRSNRRSHTAGTTRTWPGWRGSGAAGGWAMHAPRCWGPAPSRTPSASPIE